MTGDQWPLSRLFNWRRPTDARLSFRACFSIDRFIRSTKIRAKKNAPLSGKEWFFRIFGKCDFEFLSFSFFFFLEMLTPLEKVSSMHNAMEIACICYVYGRRFKSIYSSDIVHLILHLMWLISICHHYKKQETNAILRKMKIRLNRYDYQSVELNVESSFAKYLTFNQKTSAAIKKERIKLYL